MAQTKVEIFTSPTCPYCPQAVKVALELLKERGDFKVSETSTGTEKGRCRAEDNDVRSVPTLFITGDGFPDRIGYIGVPSKDRLSRMINIAQGKERWEEKKSEGLFTGILRKLNMR